MTAYAFVVTTLATGRRTGAAVLCPEARYLTIKWADANAPDRKSLSPTTWTRIGGQIAEGLDEGPLETTSPLVHVLVGEMAPFLAVQFVRQLDVDEDTAEIAAALDRQLSSLGL